MIAIVLVNYKGAADTIECLEALMHLRGEAWRIIVVDNASEDGSIERIAEWAEGRAPFERPSNQPWAAIPTSRLRQPELSIVDPTTAASSAPQTLISLVPSPDNLGFAGANNIGIRCALNDPACTHVWLLNNDTVPDPESGLALLTLSQKSPDVGIIGGTLLYYDAPDTVQATGCHFSLWRAGGHQINHLRPRGDAFDRADIMARLTYVPGASMLVTRRFIETIGPMNEAYFLYFEELDWALRAEGKFRQDLEPNAIVYHKEGRSIGTSTTARPSDRSIYYMTRSLLLLYRRHRPLLLPFALGRTVLRLIRNAFRHDWGANAAILRALRGAFAAGPS